MKTAALLVSVFIFSGCVSTKVFNNLKSETAVLQRQVKGLEGDRNFLIKVARVQDRNTGGLIELAKYLFARMKDYDNQLLIQGAGLEQANKDLEDLDGKVEKLGKKIRQSLYNLNRGQEQLAEWQRFQKEDLEKLRKRFNAEMDYLHDMVITQDNGFRKHLRDHK